MGEIDNRHLSRDSLFVLARLRLACRDGEHNVKIRNLSPGGLMAEGGPKVARGEMVAVEIRNLGWIDGTVAWVQDTRFGIAFCEEIDPRIARGPASAENPHEHYIRNLRVLNSAPDPSQLRKI